MIKKAKAQKAKPRKDSRLFTAEEKKNKKPCTAKKHYWFYAGGECICSYCGKYLQPSGKITLRP
jgi:hypothetical protein